LSFFDEDDEPRTRVRPRRAATARAAGAPDPHTARIRQLMLFGGLLLVAVILIFFVKSCRNAQKEKSLKNYNREVAAIVADSDRQVSKPFFDLMRDPPAGDLQAQISQYRVQADQQYQQAKRISTPGDMVEAQRSFLITMEQRRDGLASIADQVRAALSSDAEAADKAINEVAGAMQYFLASDVVYESRVIRFVDQALQKADVGQQKLQHTRFLPGVQWLDPNVIADALGKQLSSDGTGGKTGTPTPGLHGTGLDSVAVGGQTLTSGAANRIAYAADTEFTVNFTNQGENDETDVKVVLSIEGGTKPIQIEKTVAAVPAGAKAAATLGLDQKPPLDTPVTIKVEVKAVPGEKKTDNNKAQYDAAFFQQ
jgi:hypothetical protein